MTYYYGAVPFLFPLGILLTIRASQISPASQSSSGHTHREDFKDHLLTSASADYLRSRFSGYLAFRLIFVFRSDREGCVLCGSSS
ncbi:hypothetical protein BDQ12DRAFT_694118 [Crucibulum laeve]|uniref:Secreted protein n=1 Tax=Crucibulum laeve TaxID=68775 RepID=A0A5C3LEE1_9AGAR|nr:hypothetical protein BDQ12DRAFT_694118 [Crucibulum laeve]